MKKTVTKLMLLTIALFFFCVIWRVGTRNLFRFNISSYSFSDAAMFKDLEGNISFVELTDDDDPGDGPIISVEELVFHKNYITAVLGPLKPGRRFCGLVKNDTGKTLDHFVITVKRDMTIYSDNTGDFTGDNALVFSLCVFFLATAVLMLLSLLKTRGPDLYSYTIIFETGIFLFTGLAGIQFMFVFIRRLIAPHICDMFYVYKEICRSPASFMFYTFPLVFIFSLLMIISNTELLRHERPRLQNVLGILISVFMLLGALFGFLLINRSFQGSSQEYRIRLTFENTYCTVYTYFECMLIASIICGLRASRHRPAPEMDFIIILGCRFRKDGSLTPLLKGRCDGALEFRKKQEEKTGKAPVLIPSGGQGRDESMPEAKAMANYLLSQGVPENSIRMEDRSVNTYQNMKFSKEIIEREKKDAKVAFSTTNYHVFRSGLWAGLAGLRAEGIGNRTKWWFWPNAFMRECIGLMQNRWKQELVLLICIVVFFIVITMTLSL